MARASSETSQRDDGSWIGLGPLPPRAPRHAVPRKGHGDWDAAPDRRDPLAIRFRANRGRVLIAWLLVLATSAGSAFAAEGLILIRPSDGETIHDNSGQVMVVVSGERDAAGFQAYVDGAPAGCVQPGTAFHLEGIERGEHSLRVDAVDGDGRPVAKTETITFHMWRASRLFPGRKGQ